MIEKYVRTDILNKYYIYAQITFSFMRIVFSSSMGEQWETTRVVGSNPI